MTAQPDTTIDGQGASEQPQSGNKPHNKQVVELKLALTEAIIALADMYDQYCGDNFGHNFMGAGENAIEIIEKYGLGDERKGVDQVALTEFERRHQVFDLQPSDPDTNSRSYEAQS